MHIFNLSKFYTVNLLLWFSLIVHSYLLYYSAFTELKDAHYVVIFFYFLKLDYYLFFLCLIFLLIIIAIEAVLRKINILKSYNKLTMPLKIRLILYWTAIIFILLDLVIFRITFLTTGLLNAPYPPTIHP